MDLEKLTDIIQKIFQDALEKPVYNFGLPQPYKGKNNKIASGDLRNSIEVIAGKDEIFILMLDYGKWVQKGREPGSYVPLKPLVKWIEKRGIKFKDKKGKDLSSIAMASIISKHIHRYGIPSDPSWMDEAILELFENKEVIDMLGDITIDELIEKLNI